jgi:hypothetical protein
MNGTLEKKEVDENPSLTEDWNEKSNAFNNIVLLLESYGLNEEKLFNVVELIKKYEQKLIAWHCLD